MSITSDAADMFHCIGRLTGLIFLSISNLIIIACCMFWFAGMKPGKDV